MARRAFITGISGQDGSYLAELLLGKGYEVHGTVRPELFDNVNLLPTYLQPLTNRVVLHSANLNTPLRLAALIHEIAPDECYHLAGTTTVDSNLMGDHAVFLTMVESARALLGAIAACGKTCRFFFAGSSEMFGRALVSPQNERTAFQPRSLYGTAKLTGYHLVRQFRHRGIFACTGILYNHESPRRPAVFLPRKVSMAAARVKLGMQQRLALGNLDASRDWGYAPDYVEAMWRTLQLDSPQDFVVATGQMHTVRELVQAAFGVVGLAYEEFVDMDSRYYRPAEGVPLCGDNSDIVRVTGWTPRTGFADMIAGMVHHDMALEAAHSSHSGGR